MRTFNLSNDRLKAGIDVSYNDQGLLVGLQVKENLSLKATQWVLGELQCTLDDFLSWVKTRNATVVEVHQAISFEMFWKKYNDITRSSKKRTQVKWNKMPEAEQIKAYLYIETYERNRGSAEKKYAETYLNAELWNN